MHSMGTTLALIACKAIDASIAVLNHSDAIRLASVLWNLNHLDRPC